MPLAQTCGDLLKTKSGQFPCAVCHMVAAMGYGSKDNTPATIVFTFTCPFIEVKGMDHFWSCNCIVKETFWNH